MTYVMFFFSFSMAPCSFDDANCFYTPASIWPWCVHSELWFPFSTEGDLCTNDPCNKNTTSCSYKDGDFKCDCLKGYITTDYSNRMCTGERWSWKKSYVHMTSSFSFIHSFVFQLVHVGIRLFWILHVPSKRPKCCRSFKMNATTL